MRKKLTLVALFCGALCLTGCLKTGVESPSVTQIRTAVAAKINSEAKLNEAKAQAELIYANAEATLKQAEAALLNAKAETEKINAQLLAVRVKLAEVELEEEKVELAKKQAQLEVLLAKVEADKQYWLNVLNQLLADAEQAAIQNELAIIQAEAEMEAYILTLEGAKADSAKVYATKYYKALNKVAELQAEEVVAKVAQKLLDYGSIEARDVIHDRMDKRNETIAENEARIAYLKKYQTADPETIKAELLVAREELNNAYTDYQDAKTAEAKAKGVWEKAVEVKSIYVDDWGANFGQTVKDVIDQIPDFGYAQYNHGPYSDDYYVDEETGVKYNALVLLDEDNKVIDKLPLWTASAPDKEQYFDEPLMPATIEGIKLPNTKFSNLKVRTYYPAKIEFENIEHLFEFYEEGMEIYLDGVQEKIDEYTDNKKVETEETIASFEGIAQILQSYVDARKDQVETAEKALLDEIPNANKTHGAKENAFAEYQAYMLVTYDVDRKWFEERYEAGKKYEAAYEDSLTWEGRLADVAASIPSLKATWEQAQIDAETKKGEYVKTQKDMQVYIDEYNDQIATADYAGCRVVTATKKGEMETAAESLLFAKKELAYYQAAGDEAGVAVWEPKVAAAQTDYNKAVKAYNDAVTHETAAKAITENANKSIAYYNNVIQHAYDLWVAANYYADATTKGEYYSAIRHTTNVEHPTPVLNPDFKVVINEEDGSFYTLNPEGATVKDIRDYYGMKAEAAAAALETAEETLLTKLAEKLGVDKEDIGSTADPKADELYAAWKNASNDNKLAEKLNDLKAVYNRLDQERAGLAEYLFSYKEASFQLDPEYKYIDNFQWNAEKETYEVVKKYVHSTVKEGKTVGDRTMSSAAKAEDLQAILDDEEAFAAKCKEEYIAAEFVVDPFQAFEDMQKAIEKALENLGGYEAVEEAYVASVDNRNETYADYLDAQINTIFAEFGYNLAKAQYQALEDASNEWIYVYDPKDASGKNETGYTPDADGFVQLPIAKEIERLEKKNKELKEANDNDSTLLKAGKVTVAYANEVLDQAIETLQEAIEVWNAIALKYKALMYAYLGVVEDDETGPLDGEDEE